MPPAVVQKRDFWRRRVLHYLIPVAAVVLAVLGVAAAMTRLGGLEKRLAALERPLGSAEQLMERFKEEKEAFEKDAAKCEALRHHTGPATLTLLLMQTLHSSVPEGLAVSSLRVCPEEAGLLAVEMNGRSNGMDAATTLENLRVLVEALKVIPEVENASSTTTEKKGAEADSVPFKVRLQLRYAGSAGAEEEVEEGEEVEEEEVG